MSMAGTIWDHNHAVVAAMSFACSLHCPGSKSTGIRASVDPFMKKITHDLYLKTERTSSTLQWLLALEYGGENLQ